MISFEQWISFLAIKHSVVVVKMKNSFFLSIFLSFAREGFAKRDLETNDEAL